MNRTLVTDETKQVKQRWIRAFVSRPGELTDAAQGCQSLRSTLFIALLSMKKTKTAPIP
ncbi:hypothetical protein G4V62_08250 [Bacillaceae bacterium SIJ1]|uniref:hypothetical protein n=1 Tax=Litoribacterium kuwaitense TaxID=1398745 RepID=UPI0013EA99C1|nr:hypothetical protein [Litoribacterium kuwaitense]NGP44950.1 hypothetical protein [Litoribacterium kuwaitense]